MQSKNILFLNSGSKVAVVKSIMESAKKFDKNIKIYCADSDNEAITKYFADKFWNMPSLDKFVFDDFIKYCKQENIAYIIPSSDHSLAFWAGLKERLYAEDIFIMVSSVETVNIAYDKYRFYCVCKEKGLPCITTVKNIAEIDADLFVVKEQFGSGSKKVAIGLTKSKALEYAKNLEKPLFQPFISGIEYDVDVFVDMKNKAKACIPRLRIKSEYGEAKVTENIHNEKIERVVKQLAEELKIYGHAMIQIFVDMNQNIHIIECNSRIGGGSTLSFKCGLDTIYWFLLECSGKNLNNYPYIRMSKKIRVVRYSSDIFLDAEDINL